MNPVSKESVRFGPGPAPRAAAMFSVLAICTSAIFAQITPLENKLDQFAQHLYYPVGSKRLTVIGDSINATNTPNRMSAGYRDALHIRWNGWVVHADNGATDMGYMNAQNLKGFDFSTVWDPGEAFSGGQQRISPVRTRETVYLGLPTNGMLMSDAMLVSTSRFPAGDFFTSRPITARLITYQGPGVAQDFMLRGYRGSTLVRENVLYHRSWAPPQITSFDLDLGVVSGLPRVQIYESIAGVTPLNRWEPWRWIALGIRYRSDLVDGVQMSFISHGGWRTVDHLSQAKFTDIALREYYRQIGAPSHLIVWLGQNQTNEEANQLVADVNTAYKANLRAVIDRHTQACIALNAPAPRVLLISQFKTGYDQPVHELMAQTMFEISQEDSLVSFFNLYQAAGGESFPVATYTTDGIHPNYDGSLFLAQLIDTAMQAVVHCTADFDASGFVDTVDLDGFMQAFEAGDPAADIDASEYVDTEDFDAYMQAFERGC